MKAISLSLALERQAAKFSALILNRWSNNEEQEAGAALTEILQFAEKKMAGAAGLEPVTSAVTGQRSNQLSYAPAQNGAAKY